MPQTPQDRQAQSAALLARYTPDEIQQAMARFRARMASGTLSAAVRGVGRVKRLDASGDTEAYYPRVDLASLDELERDEQIAVAVAERIVSEAQRANANIVATAPGSAAPAPLTTFDVANAPEEVVILSPIIGG